MKIIDGNDDWFVLGFLTCLTIVTIAALGAYGYASDIVNECDTHGQLYVGGKFYTCVKVMK